MIKFQRSALAAVAITAVALIGQDAFAGSKRSIRVDLADDNFEFNGAAWDGNVPVDVANDNFANGEIPFALNIGSGATSYDFSLSENGYLSLVAPGSGSGSSALPPTGAFIAPFAADWVSFPDTVAWGLGHLVTEQKACAGNPGCYADGSDPDALAAAIAAAPRAMRFTWNGVCPVSDPGCLSGPSSAFQAVLIDRGNGDFDLELNGFDLDAAGPAAGFALGANTLSSIGPDTLDFCFRGGRSFSCDDALPAVPEAGSLSLMSVGLLVLGGAALQRRMAARRAAGARA